MEHGLIVAYRTPVKADGTRISMEEDSPIHVKDVVRMIAATQLPFVKQHAAAVTVPNV